MHPNPPRGTHLRLDGISKSYPDRRVLTDISFAVAAGERAALIGENGTGKSTLLRIVAGLEDADVGTVSAPDEVGLFHQEPPFSLDLTADEVLRDATAPLRALGDEVTSAGEHLAAHPDDPGAGTRLELALAEAERRGVWELDHTIDELVEGLGIADIPRERPVREVSGGQLARFSLAWMLVRRPETLLLDEPTNHLDDRGAELLARMLHTWPGPVLMASHDRNATVVARRVNDARTALERLENEQVRKPPKHLRFNEDRSLAAARRAGELPSGALVTASNVAARDRLRPTSLALAARERLLVEGPNGCGKSTLLEALAGRIAPDGGSVTVAPRVSVALLGQDAEVSGDDSVRDTYEQLVGAELAARRPLATFGLIAGRDETRPVNSLRVGQRRRLDLAVLLALPPDVLLLDEPTNHFSLLLSEDIERALADYPGVVVVASHDRMLRRRWTGQRLELHLPG
ncbi:hypothetical protein AA983_02260 [Dermacoccus sp. PE3]|uniref:ABC-F family ATP-binding cassette domain-containing protein n=1 Tax=Dermacoccus sp. PE3 TaxID=1641401 RepID=UPI0006423F2A|nr:ATP-binding cassette domain-containing protein [Dermacoccus sp. PE3]KLO63637.1 hypothetical protein AA983_02260 [Dermacoccus sp. PE3]